ncbi:uncharacterized protein LOC118356022 [Zalophus californianus]|uniref:Uncharacterized protein LOC118356022 n=1 Tax=Zalophus californianus TaxID=9704 RepID=A0A6P9EY66_ZALCA|nr:uncharacterized protein LOC118356022 [Zalophus californianus]
MLQPRLSAGTGYSGLINRIYPRRLKRRICTLRFQTGLFSKQDVVFQGAALLVQCPKEQEGTGRKSRGTEGGVGGGGRRAGRGLGSGEARPRVGGAGCAGPARPGIRGSGCKARPGRRAQAAASGLWGRRCPRPAPGSSGPKAVPAVLRKPPHAEERPRGGSAPETREAAGTQRDLTQGGCWPCARGLFRSVRGLRGGRWEPRPRMRRPRLRAARSAEASSRARDWGRGLRGGLSRDAQRSDSPLRDFRSEVGRGELRGAEGHSRRPSRHFEGEDGTVWKRRVGGFPQPWSLGGGETSLRSFGDHCRRQTQRMGEPEEAGTEDNAQSILYSRCSSSIIEKIDIFNTYMYAYISSSTPTPRPAPMV